MTSCTLQPTCSTEPRYSYHVADLIWGRVTCRFVFNGPRYGQAGPRFPRVSCRRSCWLWERVRLVFSKVLLLTPLRLQPLTGDYGEEPSPKALLPVANKPLIEYTLSWIDQSGIKGSWPLFVYLCLLITSSDVLLICPTIHRPALHHYIHSDAPSSNLHIDLQTYDETVASCVGTCTLLRHFAHRIQEDFVLLSCDFISPPSLPLSTLLNRFRADSGSDGSIATTCWYSTSKPGKTGSPEEWGPAAPPTSIVWDDTSGTLLHIDTTDDLDKNSEELELRMSMLSRYPRVRLSSNFQDSHVYVCRHSILNALLEKKQLDSFREEFLPWLCKVQYQKLKRAKYGDGAP